MHVRKPSRLPGKPCRVGKGCQVVPLVARIPDSLVRKGTMRTDVTSWKQKGVISLWRYEENIRNYPGWHLTADATGVESLIFLLNLMRESCAATYRTITITPPSASALCVPNNKGGKASFIAPQKWRIEYTKRAELSETWHFPVTSESASLLMGANFLALLAAGVEGILHGKGDYSIGSSGADNSVLWFWGYPSSPAAH